MFNRHRKLHIEQMEAREMMAGDVAGYVSNNTLYLYEAYGQAGRDNSVSISQIAPGTVRVKGGPAADGTISKVNGQLYTDFKVTGGLNIAFGGGNDDVTLAGVTPPSFHDVNVDLGAPLTTRTTITTTSLVSVTPADRDRITVNGLRIPGWLTINTGADNDQVSVLNTSVGQSNLKSGTANTGGINVNTGLGDDTITFDGLRSNHDINIDAGAGQDKVEVLNGAVVDNFMAQLGDGDDVLTINNLNTTIQAGTTRILGGNGTDRITMSAYSPRSPELTGWEYINGNRVFATLSTNVMTQM